MSCFESENVIIKSEAASAFKEELFDRFSNACVPSADGLYPLITENEATAALDSLLPADDASSDGGLQDGTNGASSTKYDGPFACDMCDYTTTKRCYLTRHRLNHTRRYPCPNCDYSAGRRHHLARHMVSHTGAKPYKCPVCDFKTARPVSLAQHMAITHPGGSDGNKGIALTCPFCDYRTVRRDRLEHHMGHHTTGQLMEPIPPRSAETSHGGSSENRLAGPQQFRSRWRSQCRRLYECPVIECGYTTSHRQHMERHAAKHGSVERAYPCQLCDYSATTLEYLIKHKVKHTGIKPFACTECEYTAARRSQLSRHSATVHSDKRHGRLTCSVCAFPARSPSHLACHRLTHAGERHLACPVCDYRTDNAGNLARHAAQVHTQHRNHLCPHCDYAASRREHIINHVQSAHTGEAPFKCQLCDFAGFRLSYLKRHMASVHRLQTRDVVGSGPRDSLLQMPEIVQNSPGDVDFTS